MTFIQYDSEEDIDTKALQRNLEHDFRAHDCAWLAELDNVDEKQNVDYDV